MKSFVITTAALLLSGMATQAQFGGVVFDPTQSGHAVQQIMQARQLYTTTAQTTQNVIAAYNFAKQMASSPANLYRPYISPSTYWTALNRTANTYGNSQAVINTANTGTNAQAAYQYASVPRTRELSDYGSLSPSAQQQIAAEGATTDLSDSITESNLQTLGTMRSNEIRREQDITALEQASHSMDPAQHTDMATMQRINQAMVLQLRQQQEGNQLRQAIALQQIVTQKQQQDAMKAGFQDAAAYERDYNSVIAPMTNNAADALSY